MKTLHSPLTRVHAVIKRLDPVTGLRVDAHRVLWLIAAG